ncbi:hypothetical protein [Burkholderia cepacia]|uniref:hypothetical protein n=1 Tax=Burkholderia cepacia TaxID=292 RepID=UPI002AB7D235|nr:hypothetical protein [Burkholderia cepacia]
MTTENSRADALTDRDYDLHEHEQGLYRKFDVRRVDGSSEPGGKHRDCEYFVLDMTHDQHARAALRAYADACAPTHPELSADLIARYALAPALQPAAAVSNEQRSAINDAARVLEQNWEHATADSLREAFSIEAKAEPQPEQHADWRADFERQISAVGFDISREEFGDEYRHPDSANAFRWYYTGRLDEACSGVRSLQPAAAPIEAAEPRGYNEGFNNGWERGHVFGKEQSSGISEVLLSTIVRAARKGKSYVEGYGKAHQFLKDAGRLADTSESPRTAPSPADDRAAFEAWFVKYSHNRPTATYGDCFAAWQARAASANETGAEGAKPRNRSAEWGGYLATNAERLIEAVNALHELEMREDDGEEVSEDDLQHARETLSEYMGAVRSSIYDFHRRTKQDADEAVARSPAMAAEAVAIPAEVITWRDAWQAYVDATDAYNAHLKYVRENCPFGTSVDAQYQAMNNAQRAAMALLKPMHAALSGAVGAPQPAQADAPTAPLAMTLNQDAPPLTMTILPAQTDARDEDAYVAKRMAETLATVYATIVGDDQVDENDGLNAIQRCERAAQVLRLEVELYRGQADARVGLTDEGSMPLVAAVEWCIENGNCGPRTRATLIAVRALLAAHPGQPEPRAEVTHGDTTMGECMASLLDRLEAAEVYADRYRYLRERPLDAVNTGGVFAGKTPDNVVLNGADLDAAVDAARAGGA